MSINQTDKLFALKALEKRIKTAREDLEAEVRTKLLEQYESDGTDRFRSAYFGKDAGTYTYIPPKEELAVAWAVCDTDALIEFLNEDPSIAQDFVRANAQQFGEWWLEATGEVPDGISRVTYETTKPGSTRLAVKEQVIFDKLGGNLFEAANRLMIGEENGTE